MDAEASEAKGAGPPSARWRIPGVEPQTIRHVVTETLIVAVGVLLALGVDELREDANDRRLAESTRTLIQTELERNRGNILHGMTQLRDVYVEVDKDPANAPALAAGPRGTGAPLQFDAAYQLSLQTGAFRHLDVEERKTIAEVHASQAGLDSRGNRAIEFWEELAAFEAGPAVDPTEARDRSRAIRRWRRSASSLFYSSCKQFFRIELARGRDLPDNAEGERCRGIHPGRTNPATLFADTDRVSQGR